MNTDAPAGGARPNSSSHGCVVEAFPLGMFETNCYVVYEGGVYERGAGAGGPCWIVDAGFEPGVMIDRVRALRLRPAELILTHAHVDHIAGVDEVRRAFPGLPVLIHSAETEWLADPMKNLSQMMGMPVTAGGLARTLGAGEVLELGGTSWRVLHTPGHSPGGITIYNAADGVALVGDALFAGSVGRTDFPGSSPKVLAESIRRELYTLPDATAIYPGHGPPSTIGAEARGNPFVRRVD